MKALAQNLNEAIKRRDKLSLITNAMRLVNGAGDGLDGLLIDRYHQHLHVQLLADRWHQHMDEICRLLSAAMPVEYLIVKSRRGLEINQEVLITSAAQTIVEEHGIKFEVDLNDGLNCGLFLDMRHSRRMVGQACKAKKVLNCFAYTCSFGVHARMNGAREVINTDISRKILARGEKNYQLNALLIAPSEFIKADSVAFLQRAFKKGNTFDVIILDPPSFARHEGKVFQVKRDLPKLMALAVSVLNPGGSLLVTTNYSEISHADLERMLASGVKSCRIGHIGRRVANLQRVGQDEDFTGTNSFKESFLVGLWVKFI
jgi:23S rRNA (cytosine1962-C5)-methyltransferase